MELSLNTKGLFNQVRCCVGPEHTMEFNDCKWYKIRGRSTDLTYCEYCYKSPIRKQLGDLEEIDFGNSYGEICCDTPAEFSTIQKGNIKFNVELHSHNAITCACLTKVNANNVYLFDVPSGIRFRFVVTTLEYFTVKCTRGDGKSILINNGEEIYYPPGYKLKIDNMETGSTHSFLMYVPSNKEKCDENGDKTNKFTFEFKSFKKKSNSNVTRSIHYINSGQIIDGGHYTNHLDTTVTNDTFIELDRSTLDVELVSSETQEQLEYINSKINSNHMKLWENDHNDLLTQLEKLNAQLTESNATHERLKHTHSVLNSK